MIGQKKLVQFGAALLVAGALAVPTAYAAARHHAPSPSQIPASYTDVSTLHIIQSHEEAHSTPAGSHR